MNSTEYLEKMTNIQQDLLEYIDDEDTSNFEDKFDNFKDILSNIKIQDNQHEFKSFLYLLVKISNHHHRTDNFINKIERILEHFKDDLLKYFSNSELFHIFKSNKRVLLFLFEKRIMNFDEFVAKEIIKKKFLDKKYQQYFQQEIEHFIKEEWFPKYDDTLGYNKWVLEIQKEIQKDFNEIRKIGENDTKICELIRKDLLDDFICK